MCTRNLKGQSHEKVQLSARKLEFKVSLTNQDSICIKGKLHKNIQIVNRNHKNIRLGEDIRNNLRCFNGFCAFALIRITFDKIDQLLKPTSLQYK